MSAGNHLTPLQTRDMVNALEAMRPEITANELSINKVAALLSERCKFPVTPGNIYKTAQEMGIAFRKHLAAARRAALRQAREERRAGLAAGILPRIAERLDGHAGRVEVLEARVASLSDFAARLQDKLDRATDQVATLRLAVLKLCNEFGLPSPC